MQSEKDCLNRIEVKEMLVLKQWSINLNEQTSRHICPLFNSDYFNRNQE